MSKESNYVINVTDRLGAEHKKRLSEVGRDLTAIKSQSKNIRSIVLRGGAVVDILMHLAPNDFDLFYSYEEDGKATSECKCDEVREAVNKAKFVYFDKDKVDLENSYEKEPKAEPTERTCGLISYHTAFFSMFCIDEQGQVWTNEESWKDFKNLVYEVRYEGFLPWAFFPRSGDSPDYFAFHCRQLIRAVSYIHKRKLEAGQKLTSQFSQLPYFVDKSEEFKSLKYVSVYAKSKKLTNEMVGSVIKNLNLPQDIKKNIEQAFAKMLDYADREE